MTRSSGPRHFPVRSHAHSDPDLWSTYGACSAERKGPWTTPRPRGFLFVCLCLSFLHRRLSVPCMVGFMMDGDAEDAGIRVGRKLRKLLLSAR